MKALTITEKALIKYAKTLFGADTIGTAAKAIGTNAFAQLWTAEEYAAEEYARSLDSAGMTMSLVDDSIVILHPADHKIDGKDATGKWTFGRPLQMMSAMSKAAVLLLLRAGDLSVTDMSCGDEIDTGSGMRLRCYEPAECDM